MDLKKQIPTLLIFLTAIIIVSCTSRDNSRSGNENSNDSSNDHIISSSPNSIKANESSEEVALETFFGSCTEASSVSLCDEYSFGYTPDTAKEICSLSPGSRYSTQPCDKVNPRWEKISAKCQIVDKRNRIQDITYYSSFYNRSTAMYHCQSFGSVAAFTATWIEL